MRESCKCTSYEKKDMVVPINELLYEIGPVAYDKLSYAIKKDNEIHFSVLNTGKFLVGITYAKRNDAFKIWMFDEKKFADLEPFFKDCSLPINNNPGGNIPGKGIYVKDTRQCIDVIMQLLSYEK